MWLDDIHRAHAELRYEQRLIFDLHKAEDQQSAFEALTPDEALDLDWSEVLLLALQNRVEGMLMATLQSSDLRNAVPPSVMSTLRRRAELASARHATVVDAWSDLAAHSPELAGRLILYKGLTLAPLYRNPTHRMVSDLDFVVSEEDEDALNVVMSDLGFEQRVTYRGITYVGPPKRPQIGCDYVVFDMHFEPLPRFTRDHLPPRLEWSAWTRPFDVAGVPCRRFDADLEVVICLVHLAEYASSWVHICLEDDMRLIKFLDLELHCDAEDVSADRIYAHAKRIGADATVTLGLAHVAAVRGALPAPLDDMTHLAGLVAGLACEVAIPGAGIATFQTRPAERAFLTNRPALALRMVGQERRARAAWSNHQGIPQTQVQDIASIARSAAIALQAATGPVHTEL